MTPIVIPQIPGAKLDALIAEKVMGWTDWRGDRVKPPGQDSMQFRPSTNKAAAMKVALSVCKAFGCSLRLEADIDPDGVTVWSAAFYDRWCGYYTLKGDEFSPQEASTMPLAICRAALKVVGA